MTKNSQTLSVICTRSATMVAGWRVEELGYTIHQKCVCSSNKHDYSRIDEPHYTHCIVSGSDVISCRVYCNIKATLPSLVCPFPLFLKMPNKIFLVTKVTGLKLKSLHWKMDEIDNENFSIENSNLHIQIKNLHICTTHSKTHEKSRDFSIARMGSCFLI